jgi:hypothetical protein
MLKPKTNERAIDALQLELNHHKREKAEYREDNDALRNKNMMLMNILEDLINDESYWSSDVSTKTMLFRLKNIVNSLKSS